MGVEVKGAGFGAAAVSVWDKTKSMTQKLIFRK